jgi:hypothetical protein
MEQSVAHSPVVYFLLFLLLLNSSFIPLSDSMQGVISIFSYLLKLEICALKMVYFGESSMGF